MDKKLTQLPLEHRKWTAFVLWKIIVSDGWVADEEYQDLHESMKCLDYQEFTDLNEKAISKGQALVLLPPQALDFDQASMMLFEIIRVVWLDQKFALSEMEIVEEATGLLGFGRDTIGMILDEGAGLQDPSQEKLQELCSKMRGEFSTPN